MGKLGTALGSRLRERGYKVIGSVKTRKSLERGLKMGFDVYLDNSLVAEKSNLLLLSVKPYNVAEISLRTDKPLISFVAGVPLARLAEISSRPYRAMTNVGLTAIAVAGQYDEVVDKVLRAISPVVIWVEERLMDPLTVVLGSGPAIVAKLFRAYVEAAVDVGVPWDLAKEVAAGLFSAAPQLVGGLGYEGVVEAVATPGGTTIKALAKMSGIEGLLASAFEDAVGRLISKR